MKKTLALILALVMLIGLLTQIVLPVSAETETVEPNLEKLCYDDHVDLTGKVVEIVDAGVPTSYQVGYGIAENTVPDTAVVTLDGDTLVATGIGTAKVKIDGKLYEISISAAPISLLLLAGQSNMQGSEGDANQSIVCPDGMVYTTYGDRYTMTTSNAANFAPSALTGSGCTVNVNGTSTNLEDWPVNLLREAGVGKAGPDSGYAYEWVQQTGEKVWIVNAAHGGSSITTWQEGGENYEECILLFKACMETLRKEIDAGHFTLSHMGYFWCQGCTDEQQTAEWYAKQFLSMHESLKSELTMDMDGDGTKETLEFANITMTLAGHVNKTGYRYEGGVYEPADSSFFMTCEELEMRGHRVAQYWLAANPDYPDIHLVCNLGERWVTMPDGTNGVAEYFQEHYANGTVDYPTQTAQQKSWYTSTTSADVKDSIHYNQIGYNEVGREAARNTLILLGEIGDSDVETAVTFYDWTGYRRISTLSAATEEYSATLVVPVVYPCYRSKEVTYQVSDGLRYHYFDLTADSVQITGTLTAVGATGSVDVQRGHVWSDWETVTAPSVNGPGMDQRTCSDCGKVETREVKGVWQTFGLSDHMTPMPENFCSDTNLWPRMEHDRYFFGSSNWTIHASGTVHSVTIPVNGGDRLWATSFHVKPLNGNNYSSSNGIRVTWFDKEGVLKSLTPAETYEEFTANGYLTALEGAVAVNVPMWNDSDDNELYILNRDHCYENGVCLGCGTTDPATPLEAFEYSVDAEAQTVTLTKYIGTETTVVVPDSYLIDGIPCTPMLNSETVFSGNTSITSVTLRSGVRFVGSTIYRLFAGCSSLTTVDMTGVDTSYVTSLRELFSLCYKLTNIYGYEAWDTGNVESMFKTFDRVQGMPFIDLRGWDLSNLKNSGWCFQLCYAEQILLPDNLAIISSGFLNHATKVTGSTFTIPAGVKKIGYGHTIYDFATDDFVEFIVAEGNTNYKAEDGILYSMDGTEMLAIPRNKPFEDGVYEIPEGVTFLGELSFSRNYNIRKVILPDSFVIDFVPIGDDRYIVFEDRGNLNIGSNLTIAIYCYTGITDYEAKETNPNYTSVDGILYSKNMTSVIAIPTRYGRLIQIPEGVTTWSKQAMWDDREVDDLYANHVVDNLLGACGGVCLPSTLVWMDDEQFEMINRLKVKFGDGYVITVADHNPVFYVDNDGFLTQRSVESGENPFIDVTETDYFFEPVLWAVGRGITAGTSADTFTPGAACTRAQVVTFLWRVFGKPEPASTENPFTDVTEGDYFYKAVLWAVANGITSGTGNGCFSPNSPCTRNQVVTFLWRAVGRPAPELTVNPFIDVPEGIYYHEPVLWAIEKGITSGTGGASFSPDAPCIRGQVVTFLYRTFSHP